MKIPYIFFYQLYFNLLFFFFLFIFLHLTRLIFYFLFARNFLFVYIYIYIYIYISQISILIDCKDANKNIIQFMYYHKIFNILRDFIIKIELIFDTFPCFSLYLYFEKTCNIKLNLKLIALIFYCINKNNETIILQQVFAQVF
jgi:hypothetical protein